MPAASDTARATPLTDAWIREIATRLRWRGARSAAARYAGISRQNLGKFFREKGVGRDSEVLLRLDRFSRLPRAEQLLYRARGTRRTPTEETPPPPPTAQLEPGPDLPHWML